MRGGERDGVVPSLQRSHAHAEGSHGMGYPRALGHAPHSSRAGAATCCVRRDRRRSGLGARSRSQLVERRALRLSRSGLSNRQPRGARDDGRNRVVLRTSRPDPDELWDRTVQAHTSVHPRRDTGPRDGEISDTDIEINGVDFRWSRNGERPGTRSLRAALGHELGRALGLDHACHPGAPSRDGRQPRCDETSARSIMNPDLPGSGPAPDRSPTADAVAALCGPIHCFFGRSVPISAILSGWQS
jgi:hypothetical protein